MAAVTLVLADDHPIVLHGLQELFRAEPDFRVLATCEDGEACIQAVRIHRPDVLLLDLRLPRIDGFGVLRTLRTEGLRTRTVLLTAFADEHAVVEATRLGVSGIVLKDSSHTALIDCIRHVATGGVWFDRELLSTALDRTLKHHEALGQATGSLTARELVVARMVADGCRNREIAEQLHISEGTVKVHLHNVYKKLALDGRVALMRYVQKLVS